MEKVVAQALLAHDEKALAFQRLAQPARRIYGVEHRAAEARVVAHLPFGEAFFELAQTDKGERAAVMGFDGVRMLAHELQRFVVIAGGVLELAGVAQGVGDVVIGTGKARLEPQRLLIEDLRLGDRALLHRNRAQRIPKLGLVGKAVDRAAQDLDRIVEASQIAQHAAQIVVAQVALGIHGDVDAEEFLRALEHAELPSHEPEIEIDLRILWIELHRALVHEKRLVQVAQAFER